MGDSLFHVAEAADVEKEVLAAAEARLQKEQLPKFRPKNRGLGFSKRVLGGFLTEEPTQALQLALSGVHDAMSQLRAAKVREMLPWDKLRLKEQVLLALISHRADGGGDELGEAVNGVESGTELSGAVVEEDEEQVIRGELTPFEAAEAAELAKSEAAQASKRGRMTVMDYKIQAGANVVLPHKRSIARKRKRQQAAAAPTTAAVAAPLALGGSTRSSSSKKGKNPAKASAGDGGELGEMSDGSGSLVMGKGKGKSEGEGAAVKGVRVREKVGGSPAGVANASRSSRRSSRGSSTRGAARGSAASAATSSGSSSTSSRRKRGRSTQSAGSSDAPPGPAGDHAICPMCQKAIPVMSGTPDQVVSSHLDRCIRRGGGDNGEAKGDSTWLEWANSSEDDAVELDQDSGEGSDKACSTPRATASEESESEGEVELEPNGGAPPVRGMDKSKGKGGAGPIKLRSNFKAMGGLIDDMREDDYQDRLVGMQDKEEWQAPPLPGTGGYQDADGGSSPDVKLEGGLVIPGRLARRLFVFQHTGVRWLWQLYRQGAGGIIGDEMGLGKTVQVVVFLGALQQAGKLRRTLILAPATVLSHWVAMLRLWAPKLRTVLLHRSGAAFDEASARGGGGVARLIAKAVRLKPAVVCVGSYASLKAHRAVLVLQDWDYVVLDEGQRIRNPDAEVTLVCKQLRTVHRLVLTGTPIQNSLKELWSLFDFAFPGRLGTLPAFEAEFSSPIRAGGYANAGPLAVRAAVKCAIMLRQLIGPYLLRRQKKDVETVLALPQKTEQVLFCRLTSHQRDIYAGVLASPEVDRAVHQRDRGFRALGILRKLCNHPDLVAPPGLKLNPTIFENMDAGSDEGSDDEQGTSVPEEFGAVERSGKMLVLQHVLPLWKDQGHKVLVFCQTRQMLNILEKFVRHQGWRYGRLDGNTPVGSRQSLMDRYNNDPEVFIMLLTTRTGGVGTNLTGADRVVLYDPDWNPSTDAQARERAWRVGQAKPVTVFRLITAGTLEEKIYHRQIFKTSMTNRVLKDPKQRRLFSSSELRDLFTLGPDGAGEGATETGDLFGEGEAAGTEGPDGATAGADDEDGAEKEATDDGQVLKALFDESLPLTSVFKHDLAEGETGAYEAAREVEKQADAIARQALEELRRSAETIPGNGFAPTWTGRNGGAAAAGPKRFGRVSNVSDGGSAGAAAALRSAALLQRLRETQERSAAAADGVSSSSGNDEYYRGLVLRLQAAFGVGREPKELTTQELLQRFGDVPDKHAAVFKQLLMSVAKRSLSVGALGTHTSLIPGHLQEQGPKLWRWREEVQPFET
ncbi:unnamed protein product [Chrysoparadoxa australica]